LLGLLLLAAVGWLAVKQYTPAIQEDLLERSRASLDNAGFADNTSVSIDGRNITIDGTVPTDTARQQAEEVVGSTFGVRSVINNLNVGDVAQAPAETEGREAPTLSVTTEGNRVSVAGSVSDQKFADALAEAVAAEFSDGEIDTEIAVDDASTNPGWTAAVVQLLPDLKTVENGAISIQGGTATISGNTDDAQIKAAIGDKATALLGSQLAVVNQIEAPESAPPALPAFASISETEDTITLNGFMSAEGAAIVAQAYESGEKTVVNNISIDERAETPAWADNFSNALGTLEGVSDGRLTMTRSGSVRLQGSVESDDQKQSVGDSVAELFGTDTSLVNNLEVVPPPVVPTMTPFASISQSADSVTISGLLPKQAATELLQSYANDDREIVDRITVDERVMQPEWLEAMTRSGDRLAAIENSSINLASNGTVTLRGEAQSEQAKQFTSITVRTLFGNAVDVENEISVAEPEMVPSLSPFFSINQSDQGVTISGLLPAEAADEITGALADGGKPLTNNITVDERVMQPAWSTAASQSLSSLEKIESGGINIASNGTLSLRGEVASEQAKQFAGINFGRLFGDSVSLRNDITVKTPTIVEPPKPDIRALLSELDLSGIRFRSGSTELDGDSLQILDEVVEVLNLVGDAQILIAGHTDSRGNADYNFSLSADRAAAVQQYLINRGIAAGRLTARGYGPTQPIATNDTAAGRALNRRIEIQLIGE
jgi:outer membrane protein OmpA-like peptidoglycan-associated protein